jgi:hypothetical protein
MNLMLLDAFDTFGDSSQPATSQNTSRTMRRRKAIYIAKYIDKIEAGRRRQRRLVLDSISADTYDLPYNPSEF